MNRWLVRTLSVGALALGGLAFSGSAAQADWNTYGNFGALNGNQFSSTIQVPINVCGNSIAVLGISSAHCGGGAYAINGGGWGGRGYDYDDDYDARSYGDRHHSRSYSRARSHNHDDCDD